MIVYKLKLQNNKYYVGITKNINRRYKQHLKGKGADWTKINKPIEIMDIIKNGDRYIEETETLKLMEKYGIENVRGGSYCRIKLPRSDIEKIYMIHDKCYKCGSSNHYGNTCTIEIRKYVEYMDK